MIDKLIWIPALIFLLGTLVCFHELGHFTMAKLLGIGVKEFAFGFGPKWLVLAKRGETEYTIHPYPLGGFVKLAGDEIGEDDVPNGFNSKPWWKRWLVYVSGPFMSLLLAYLIFCAMGVTVGLPINHQTMNVVDLLEPGSVAEKAGIKVGDVITAIDGKTISTGKQLLDTVHSSGDKLLTLTIRRGESIKEISAVPDPRMLVFESLGFSASRPGKGDLTYRIGHIERKSAASRAGLMVDDGILSIDGRKTESGPAMVDIARRNGEKPLLIVLTRGEDVVKFTLTPDARKLSKDTAVAFLGFIPKQKLQRVGLVRSIKFGNDTTIEFGETMITVLFSKEVKNAVGGPLAIANETQNGVKRGAYGYLQLMAALSLSLGVFNLMPIPVVDGGQMALLVVEGIKRKRLSRRTWELAQIVGIAMIAVIFLLVMTIDIGRIANGTLFRQ